MVIIFNFQGVYGMSFIFIYLLFKIFFLLISITIFRTTFKDLKKRNLQIVSLFKMNHNYRLSITLMIVKSV